MAGVRIKDLQDARSVIDKFDEMQFAVDSGNPDTTLRLSGKDLKQVIGTPKHTHPVEEVDGLPGVLEKKLDTTGSTITGDLHVEGDTHVRNIRVDEYLEVPELKYNRITATGNEFCLPKTKIVSSFCKNRPTMNPFPVNNRMTISGRFRNVTIWRNLK